MPVTVARMHRMQIQHASSYDKELSDTSTTSHDEQEDEDHGLDMSESEYDHSKSEYDSQEDSDDESGSEDNGDDDSSSWDDDEDDAALEQELRRFTLGRSASCSKLGGGFPSLGQVQKLSTARPKRLINSFDMKDLVVSAGLAEDVDDETEDHDDDPCPSDDESVSESEGLDEQLEQLKASVGSMYNMPGLTKPPKAVPPKLNSNLGLVEQDDKNMEMFLKGNAGQPLTIIQTDSHQTTKTNVTKDARKPEDVLRSILKFETRLAYPSAMWEGYFLEVQNSHIRAHTKEMEIAVRCEDYGKLRAMMRKGQTLQSCNQHGESIIHLACRRSSVKLLKFLINDAYVTVRVRDDYGRSPLHDTCWSYNDRFDIFKALLEDSPELLHVEDRRGFSPFDYIPKQRWNEWNKFLEANADFLRKTINVVDLADMEAYYQRTH